MSRCALGFAPAADARRPVPPGLAAVSLGGGLVLVTASLDRSGTPRDRLAAGLDLHGAGWTLAPFAPRLRVPVAAAEGVAARAAAGVWRLLDLAGRCDEIALSVALPPPPSRRAPDAGPQDMSGRADASGERPMAGRAWLQARARRHDLQAAQEAGAADLIRALLGRLGARDLRVARLGDRALGVALVARGMPLQTRLAAAAAGLGASLGDAAPSATGPWPPYSFAQMEPSS